MLQKYSTKLIIYIIALFISLLAFTYLIVNTQNYVSIALVLIVAIAEVINIIFYIHKTNRQISIFFNAISVNDLTISPNFSNKGKSFDELNDSLLTILQTLKKNREETETQLLFNTNMLQNVGVGIIAINHKNEIEFSNKLFHNMTKVPYCTDLSKIAKFNPSLAGKLQEVKEHKKALFKIEIHNDLQHYLLTPSFFRIKNKEFKLVVVQNIQPTIDQTEMDAWQKLIRVLTHEIMNSITPISSLSETAATMLRTDNTEELHDETIIDLREALQTIHKRSNGLLTFVQEYRTLTTIPQPKLELIQIKELFTNIKVLFESEIKNTNITFTEKTQHQNLEVVADSVLLEQVILNLLKNARHAVEKKNNAAISLSALQNEYNKIEIIISDNGLGILPEVIDKIFIPFFTTKNLGSGIGLSLSKQIMVLHGGNITVSSKPNDGSEFTLRF